MVDEPPASHDVNTQGGLSNLETVKVPAEDLVTCMFSIPDCTRGCRREPMQAMIGQVAHCRPETEVEWRQCAAKDQGQADASPIQETRPLRERAESEV